MTIDLLPSIHRALWQEISPNVRAIFTEGKANAILLRVVIDGPIHMDDQEAMERVKTEILADHPEARIDLKLERVDFPAAYSTSGQAIFARREGS